MTKNTKEDTVLSKLEYIGLNLAKIPAFLKQTKKIDYRPSKNIEENKYRVYRYIPISKIRILLTPCNRLNTIIEKYKQAKSIADYLDSKQEENIINYATFLKMLKQVNLSEIEDLESKQKELKKQVPFLVKFNSNYLWQIYYSDIEDTYFMLVPTEDLDYAAFFYLLKKQIELKKSKKEEFIYVPISHEEYSGEYLKSSQILDLEKYICFFAKDWPITYEVYDKEGNMSLQIVGKAHVYENIQSEYKIKFQDKEEVEKFYKLLKALFILNTEMPHYYKFKLKVNYLGGLDFIYGKKKITYDSLMELLVKEYENMKNQINTELENSKRLQINLEKLKKEGLKKEQEYFIKEKQIATYLECKKTFFGKVKYFFKSKKIQKELDKNVQEDIKQNVEELPKEETKEIEFIQKEYYTIEDIIKICKDLDEVLQNVKNFKLDIEAQERKIKAISKKIENATLYIEEIDKHEKNIFEFWKFANKDEQNLLQEGTKEDQIQDNKLEKVFDYNEDFKEIGNLIDKKQRNNLNNKETDAIFIATTELLKVLNDCDNKDLLEESLKELKKQAEEERILFNTENFDLFGNVVGDNTKIQVLSGKKHRENMKDKLKILDVTKNLNLEEYQDKMLDILNIIYEAIDKSSSPISVPIYYVGDKDLEENAMQVFCINPEEMLKENINEKELNLYKLDIKENMPIVYFTNSIYYDNNNKTLPLGMDIKSKCLIKLSDYETILKEKDEFRVTNIKDELKVNTIKINVYEYDLRKKEEND